MDDFDWDKIHEFDQLIVPYLAVLLWWLSMLAFVICLIGGGIFGYPKDIFKGIDFIDRIWYVAWRGGLGLVAFRICLECLAVPFLIHDQLRKGR